MLINDDKTTGLFTSADVTAPVTAQPWPDHGWEIWTDSNEGLADAIQIPHDWTIERQVAEVRASRALKFVVPVSPVYFWEIAKFRAMRRLRPDIFLIARTSRYFTTAYDPHVNLLRGTAGAMAAILGGCDAVIVGPFDEARGDCSEFARRLALNTQLLLREEAGFWRAKDPAAGSWCIEALTARLAAGLSAPARAPVFVGVTKYANLGEAPPPASVTTGRAASALELCRLRSERAPERPRVQLVLGLDAKMSRIRAGFVKGFFGAGGFLIGEEPGPIIVLCDADGNYASLAASVSGPRVLVAGPEELKIAGVAGYVNAKSDQASTIEYWQRQLGIL